MGEFDGGGLSGGGAAHFLQDLEESPALAVVALVGVDAFALEIDVVDEGILAAGGGGGAVVVALHAGGVAAGGLHDFGKGGAGLGDDEVGLEGDVVGEPVAESGHGAAVEFAFESDLSGPGRAATEGDGGGIGSLLAGKGDELGEGLGVRAAFSGGIPDEVADAEGGEGFAVVPSGEAVAGAAGFVLPNLAADGGFLGGGEGASSGGDGDGAGAWCCCAGALAGAGTVGGGAGDEAGENGRGEKKDCFHHLGGQLNELGRKSQDGLRTALIQISCSDENRLERAGA